MACQGCYNGWTLQSEIKIDNYSCPLKEVVGGMNQSVQIQEECE